MNNNVTIELSVDDRDRLDHLIRLLEGLSGGTALEKSKHLKPAEPTEESIPPKGEDPAKTKNGPSAPDRRTVKSVAVTKIQAGHRDEVKALIQRFGAEKIDLVPEDKLNEFFTALEKIGA